MSWLKISMAAYGLMNLIMGIEAFAAKGSLPSLLGGGIAGLLVLYFVWLIPTKPRIAYIGTLVVCLALTGRFLPNYLKDTEKIYPALIIVATSALLAIALLASHFMAMRAKRSVKA